MTEREESGSAVRRFLRKRARLAIVLTAVLFWSGRLFGPTWWALDLLTHFTAHAAIGSMAFLALFLGCGGGRGAWPGRAPGALVPLVLGTLTALVATADLLRWSPAQSAMSLSSAGASEHGVALRIACANVHSRNPRKDLVVDWLKREDPDVVVLIEIDEEWVRGLRELTDEYPFSITHPDDRGNFGIGCWSRYPLDASRGLFGLGGELPQLDLGVRLEGTASTVRLFGLHPPPPVNAGATAERNRLIAAVAERAREARAEGERVVLIGDLNCSRYSEVVQRLAEVGQLRDAGSSEAVPALRTWPATLLGRLLGTVIDHCFVGSGIAIDRFEVGPSVGSDHFPLVVELRLSG